MSQFPTRIMQHRFVWARVFGQLVWPRGFLEFIVRATQKNRKMNCFLQISSRQGAGQKNTEKICFLTARSFSVGPLLLLHKITEFAFCAPSYHVCSLVEKTHFDHRHPSDCLHYLARCVFFVIIPHRCANNWCTLGVSWPFQAFDFSFFFVLSRIFRLRTGNRTMRHGFCTCFFGFRAQNVAVLTTFAKTQKAEKHEKFEHFCGRAKGAANTCKKTYGGT